MIIKEWISGLTSPASERELEEIEQRHFADQLHDNVQGEIELKATHWFGNDHRAGGWLSPNSRAEMRK